MKVIVSPSSIDFRVAPFGIIRKKKEKSGSALEIFSRFDLPLPVVLLAFGTSVSFNAVHLLIAVFYDHEKLVPFSRALS